jgi:hypothetical protein
MVKDYPQALSVSRNVLRVLIKVNFFFGVFIFTLLVSSIVAETTVFRALGALPAGSLPDDGSSLLLGMRAVMVIGLLAIPVTHFVLTGLLAMVDTVRNGNPFIAQNAERLRAMAWAMLVLEIMNIIVGLIAKAVSTQAIPIDLNSKISITRWLAVILLFVLARVFDEGTRMREELEGTV